jgi:alkylated DNA repair dioxygenase AlkB
VSPTATLAPYADVVDLERYPIHDLASPEGQALLERCHAELAEKGVCSLPGFVRPAAVARMIEIADAGDASAWASDQVHTVYFEEPDDSLGADHPLARTVRSAKHGIAYDQLPADAPLRRLYEHDDLTAFIAAVLSKDVLYRSADPLDALQVTTFRTGEELGWHFDNSEFSVTVMYQQSEEGGDFDYVPGTRDETDERYDVVQAALEEDPSLLVRLESSPGAMAIFRGHHALHRVTKVVGPTPRINSVLTYGERPDMRLSDLTSMLFYGRTSS